MVLTSGLRGNERLRPTGGKLELPKCFLYVITWIFDKQGDLVPTEVETAANQPNLTIIACEMSLDMHIDMHILNRKHFGIKKYLFRENQQLQYIGNLRTHDKETSKNSIL